MGVALAVSSGALDLKAAEEALVQIRAMTWIDIEAVQILASRPWPLLDPPPI